MTAALHTHRGASRRRTEHSHAEAFDGLPGWTYTDAELLADEHDHVFRRTWQIVCHHGDLPTDGSYVVLDLFRDSVVVVRRGSGDYRAFLNACRHRGTKLLDGAGSCGRHIRCPYHGWTYDLSGALKAVPERRQFPGIDFRTLNLRRVALELFHGFIFVRIEAGAPSVAAMWGSYAADMAEYRFDVAEPLAPIVEEEWPVNWKVAVENNLESYHVAASHPALFRVVGRATAEDSLGTGVMRGENRLREKPLASWSERIYQKHVGSVSGHLPPASRKLFRFFSMLPNLAVDVYPDLMRFLQIIPRGPERCVIRTGTYGLPDGRREAAAVRYANGRLNRAVMREDRAICERTQFGMSSRDYRPGPLASQEEALKEFHDMLRLAVPPLGLTAGPGRRPPRARDNGSDRAVS
jgi:phenylpropionate dioxygenase-like ring-hydroxylating dioxygenase large terminal subunit